jgi:hypothetical protein
MKLSKSYAEMSKRRQEIQKQLNIKQKRFAWYPLKLKTGEWVWLETVLVWYELSPENRISRVVSRKPKPVLAEELAKWDQRENYDRADPTKVDHYPGGRDEE